VLPEKTIFQMMLEKVNQFKTWCAKTFLKGDDQSLKTILKDAVHRAETAWYCAENPMVTTTRPCFCPDLSRNSLILQCTNCEQSYHGACVHLTRRPIHYKCPACDFKKILDVTITLRPWIDSLSPLMETATTMSVGCEEATLLCTLVHTAQKWGETVAKELLKPLSVRELRSLIRMSLLIEVELPEHRNIIENLLKYNIKEAKPSKNSLKIQLRLMNNSIMDASSSPKKTFQSLSPSSYASSMSLEEDEEGYSRKNNNNKSLTPFCICESSFLLPSDSRPLIECNYCGIWYHMECVHISPEQTEKMKEFMCSKCRDKNQSNQTSLVSTKTLDENDLHTSLMAPPTITSSSTTTITDMVMTTAPKVENISLSSSVPLKDMVKRCYTSKKRTDYSSLAKSKEQPLVLKIKMSAPLSTVVDLTVVEPAAAVASSSLSQNNSRTPSSSLSMENEEDTDLSPSITTMEDNASTIDMMTEGRTKRKAKKRFDEFMKRVRSDGYKHDQ
jgi:hypothetical protein